MTGTPKRKVTFSLIFSPNKEVEQPLVERNGCRTWCDVAVTYTLRPQANRNTPLVLQTNALFIFSILLACSKKTVTRFPYNSTQLACTVYL